MASTIEEQGSEGEVNREGEDSRILPYSMRYSLYYGTFSNPLE